MEVTVILGVRPHYIKADALKYILSDTKVNLKFLDIHQHYDKCLREIYIKESGLEVITQSKVEKDNGSKVDDLANQILDVGNWLLSEEGKKSKAIIVFGDANPAFSGSIVANRLGLPIIHIEAGVRRITNEKEHWNSLVADHLSSLRYCYTNKNLEELNREGLNKGSYLVGDLFARWTIDKSKECKLSAIKDEYILISIHRPQNCNENALRNLCEAVSITKKKVIWILHPRVYDYKHIIKSYDYIYTKTSQSHLDILSLLKNAFLIITDSGGLVREGVLLDKKVIVCHEQGMWVNLVENNAILRSDMEIESLKKTIENAIKICLNDGKKFFLIENGEEIFKESLISFLEKNN